ncbi:MAG: hypothetical protein V1827_03160, partial [Candidatus Micrarchaeota archaeon]
LDRTIAEQGLASGDFTGQMGFMGQSYSFPSSLSGAGAIFDMLMSVLLLPFSWIGNIFLALVISLLNFSLGMNVEFSEKAVSFLHLWIILFLCSVIYGLFRFFKKQDDQLALLIVLMVMPPLLVGILKAKYTIYAAALLAIAIGFTFSQAGLLSERFLKDEDLRIAKKILLILAAVMVIAQFFSQGFAPALAWSSLQPLYQNDPAALSPKFQEFCTASGDADICAAAADPIGYASQGTNYQYSAKLCMMSVFSKMEYASGSAPAWESQAAYFRCQRLSDYWTDSMEWLRYNTEPGSRVMSWWDYGHWINYFGLRNAVVRNEHISHTMIGDVAHGYLDATPEELKEYMKSHDIGYALFDIELIAGGGSLGGKYGALNYLSCARDNDTNVSVGPGASQCEADHLWENIFISQNPCTISALTGKAGYTAYKIYIGESYMVDYPDFCVAPTDPRAISYCRDYIRAIPAYCIGNVTLASGQSTYGTYHINETYPNGDLKLNKALLQLPYTYPDTYHFGPATRATLLYTNDMIWLENGEVKGGYEDRKGKFYDSALYRAIFLNDIPGFKGVYQTSGGEVKIYQIED